jgi:hypothetical protein
MGLRENDAGVNLCLNQPLLHGRKAADTGRCVRGNKADAHALQEVSIGSCLVLWAAENGQPTYRLRPDIPSICK